MKPLTIDELKALEVGDWVWIVFPNNKGFSHYKQKMEYNQERFYACASRGVTVEFNYSDYGKTWLAYKNKEQAEAKGEIVELPCKVGDKIYLVALHTMYNEWGIVEEVVSEGSLYLDCVEFERGMVFFDKSAAKAKLKKLRGESR